jgi:hypothetical protein
MWLRGSINARALNALGQGHLLIHIHMVFPIPDRRQTLAAYRIGFLVGHTQNPRERSQSYPHQPRPQDRSPCVL